MESSKKVKVSKQYPKNDSYSSFVYTTLRNDSSLFSPASPDRKINEELKCSILFGLIVNELDGVPS